MVHAHRSRVYAVIRTIGNDDQRHEGAKNPNFEVDWSARCSLAFHDGNLGWRVKNCQTEMCLYAIAVSGLDGGMEALDSVIAHAMGLGLDLLGTA